MTIKLTEEEVEQILRRYSQQVVMRSGDIRAWLEALAPVLLERAARECDPGSGDLTKAADRIRALYKENS